MCGIVGYIGDKNGANVVVDGLKKLEYRGYDSWGLAGKKDKEIMRKYEEMILANIGLERGQHGI